MTDTRRTIMKRTKQLAILEYIYDKVQEQGYPPTVREICVAVGLSSTSTVHGHLERLEKNGFIHRGVTKTRAIEITELGLQELGVTSPFIPILGTVTAGSPILAVEQVEDYFPIPPHLEHESDLFMLKIRGESMVEAGIFDGDLVIVKKQSTAQNGEIVIAMTDEDEATCKRFYKEQHYYRLQPENETMDPILLSSVTILGKVVGLYRSDIW